MEVHDSILHSRVVDVSLVRNCFVTPPKNNDGFSSRLDAPITPIITDPHDPRTGFYLICVLAFR
jgi:hypothetical protein